MAAKKERSPELEAYIRTKCGTDTEVYITPGYDAVTNMRAGYDGPQQIQIGRKHGGHRTLLIAGHEGAHTVLTDSRKQQIYGEDWHILNALEDCRIDEQMTHKQGQGIVKIHEVMSKNIAKSLSGRLNQYPAKLQAAAYISANGFLDKTALAEPLQAIAPVLDACREAAKESDNTTEVAALIPVVLQAINEALAEDDRRAQQAQQQQADQDGEPGEDEPGEQDGGSGEAEPGSNSDQRQVKGQSGGENTVKKWQPTKGTYDYEKDQQEAAEQSNKQLEKSLKDAAKQLEKSKAKTKLGRPNPNQQAEQSRVPEELGNQDKQEYDNLHRDSASVYGDRNRWTHIEPEEMDEKYRRHLYDYNGEKRFSDYEPMRQAVSGIINKTRQRIEQVILERDKTRTDRNQRRGRIDGRALHKAAAGNSRIYKRKVEPDKVSLAVSIQIDQSGSMNGRRADMAAKAAIALAESLAGLNIPLEVSGYQGGPRFNHFIRFSDNLQGSGSKAAKERLTYSPATTGGGNADSPALLEAMARMEHLPQRDKIILMLCDGEPAYTDYPNIKNAVDLARRRGILVIGVGIEFLGCAELYPVNFTINDCRELPAALADTIRKHIDQP